MHIVYTVMYVYSFSSMNEDEFVLCYDDKRDITPLKST